MDAAHFPTLLLASEFVSVSKGLIRVGRISWPNFVKDVIEKYGGAGWGPKNLNRVEGKLWIADDPCFLERNLPHLRLIKIPFVKMPLAVGDQRLGVPRSALVSDLPTMAKEICNPRSVVMAHNPTRPWAGRIVFALRVAGDAAIRSPEK